MTASTVELMRAIDAVRSQFTLKSIEHMDADTAKQLPRFNPRHMNTQTREERNAD